MWPYRHHRANSLMVERHSAIRRLADSGWAGRNTSEELGCWPDLWIAPEFWMRDQPHVALGDGVGDRDQIVMPACNEPGKHGDSNVCARRGEQGVSTVCFEHDARGRMNRLKPLRV